MISESSLRKICSLAVLSRARDVADRGLRIHNRRCAYDGHTTIISAEVDATFSYDGTYETSVTLDEEADAVCDYGCTCPAARRYAGPCKHAVALVLDFNERAREYRGYSPTTHVTTSRGIVRYLERAQERPTQAAGTVTEEGEGTVSLGLTLVHDAGFDARFSVEGSRGSYVVKSVGDLVDDVEAGRYHKYGKKLAFTHVRSAFDARSQRVLDFLARAVRNRRAYTLERATSRSYTGTYHASARDMHLSEPELGDLCRLYEGEGIYFQDRAGGAGRDAQTRRLEVRLADPEVSCEMADVGSGSFEVVRHGKARFWASYGHLYAWDDHAFYRCSDKLSQSADLLVAVFDDTSQHVLVGDRDIRAFCAVALPRLERAMHVSGTDRLDDLRPAPLELSFYLDYGRSGATCLAVAAYGKTRYPLFGARDASDRDVVRDNLGESQAREVVQRYFPVGDGGRLAIASRNGDALATLVYEGVPELRRLGQVFTTPAFDHLRSTARPKVHVGVSVRSNLVDLTVSTEDLPLPELHALLTSYRLKKHYHRLRDGSIVDISKLDLDEVSTVVDELGLTSRELSSGSVRVPSYKAFLLDNIMSDEEKDASFERYLEGFRAMDPTVYEPPVELAKTLRPYQVEGFQWLSALCDMGFGGILADEMGLGKSVQLIALLLARRDEARKVGPSLVVCPASLVYNWQAEFAKFAPGLSVLVVAGTAAERRQMRRRGGYDVLVTSYDLLRRDVEDYAAMHLWCEVLDEAQYIKNHETLAARAVKVLSSEHRFALTGTPVENRLSELWSIFDFLMPGLLGSYERFRERYERPITEDGDEEAASRLRAAVRPFVLRRLKRDVLSDLPDKLEQTVHAHMEGEQRDLYAAHVQQLRLSLDSETDEAFGTSKLQVLAALTRLRQICCDPRLVYEDYDGPSCKMDAIMDLVEQAVDARAKMLVFSQFTSFLDLIAAALDRRGVSYYTITGSTPKKRRLELVDAFNADETPVFLISLKAGGTGLNLTGASIVLHADPWWNAAAEEQATDRAHRIGQTKDVTVYRVICEDTIEERILDMQDAKSELAESVVDGKGGTGSLASLTREDLIDLLG